MTQESTREALARAAARAYEAAHGNPLPEPARGLRWSIRPRAAATAAVVIAILVAFAVLADAASPRAAVPLATPSLLDAPSLGGPGDRVTVHVVGAVASPGLYELDPGARIADAVKAAGGAQDDADLAAVNLAREVVDGEQVVVPRVGEAPAAGAAGSGRVGLNGANAAELESLPGIGPVLAERIVQDRERNGPFRSVEDLTRVPGVGPAVLERIRDLVTM
nr:MAG: competence protein ComEA [Actinomycetota bacterium]